MSNNSPREFWIVPEYVNKDEVVAWTAVTDREHVTTAFRKKAFHVIEISAVQKLQAQLDEADTALTECCLDDCAIDLEKTSAEDLRDIIRAIDERARTTLASLRKEK